MRVVIVDVRNGHCEKDHQQGGGEVECPVAFEETGHASIFRMTYSRADRVGEVESSKVSGFDNRYYTDR